MKKTLYILAVFIAMCIVTPAAMAQVEFRPSSTDVNNVGGCDGAAANSPVCQDINDTGNPLFGPEGILTTVAGIFGVITGVISVFMMLIAGLRYINSSGDPQKTATARKTIIYAAVGVVVSVVAGVGVRFILSKVSN